MLYLLLGADQYAKQYHISTSVYSNLIQKTYINIDVYYSGLV